MNASKTANAEKSFRVLVMGLPGSGKTTLTEKLRQLLPVSTHLNADEVRKEHDDWDFSDEGRLRQAHRMREKADQVGGLVFGDFVCPTAETREAFAPHLIVLMKTIEAGRYEDTNKVFVEPGKPDFVITGWGYDTTELYEMATLITKLRPQGIMIGRFQPFHGGHKALLGKVIEKHGFASIFVRMVPQSKNNPINLGDVFNNIRAELDADPNFFGRYAIMPVPNIAGVYYGRDVGYNVEQIDLGADIHAISATDIRKERGIDFDREAK